MDGEISMRSALFEQDIKAKQAKEKEKSSQEEIILPTLVPLNGGSNQPKNNLSKQKMSKLLKIYKEFPEPILEQIAYLNKKFPSHPQIDRKSRHVAKEENIDLKIARALIIYEFFDTRDFFHQKIFDERSPEYRRIRKLLKL